jgi:hypothetical protein
MVNFDNITFNKDQIDIVIYHKNCHDGFGGAYVVWKYYKDTNNNREIEYCPAYHNDEPPDVTNKNVLITDFCYNKTIIEQMIKDSNSLLILDHHKTSQKALENIDSKYKVFDMNYSGAYLTWLYFNDKKKAPLLIEYIQDRDLWVNKLEYTEEFTTYMNTCDFNFELWETFTDEHLLTLLKNDGKIMNVLKEALIKKIVSHYTLSFEEINNEYYFVVYLNSNLYRSEVGNILITNFKDADFSAIYSLDNYKNKTYFSLRSTDKNYDVSQIATLFNGGGHRNASGVCIDYVSCTLTKNIIDNNLYNKLYNIEFSDILINDKKYLITVLKTSSYKNELGKYLLQTKYIDQDKKIQNCSSIKNNTNYHHISIVWNLIKKENKLNIIINFDKDLSVKDLTNIKTVFYQNSIDYDFNHIPLFIKKIINL